MQLRVYDRGADVQILAGQRFYCKFGERSSIVFVLQS